jgi:hypothetical protein
MISRRKWHRATIFFLSLGFVATIAVGAIADPFDYSEDFGKFGQTQNFTCQMHGACGAVASINSFTYLQKQFPQVYGTSLVPGLQMNGTDTADAQKFGFTGWTQGTNPMRTGYYNRTGTAEGDFIDTKKDWFHDFAPNTTVFDTWWTGSPDHNRKPTIADLAQEIKDKEDVEFFVDDGNGFYHVMTLTGVACDMNNACSIKYQDPNSPGTNQSAAVTSNNNMLMFTGVPGSNFNGTVTITAAFAESPMASLVPEPSTFVMLAMAGAGLVVFRRRQRA